MGGAHDELPAPASRSRRPLCKAPSYCSCAPWTSGTAAGPAAPAPTASTGGREEEVVPMTRLRQIIAKRLVEAQQNAALLTTFNEADRNSTRLNPMHWCTSYAVFRL